MAATGYTPIQLYYSTTASAAPTAGNLLNGELALNITDGKLFYKDNGGVVQTIANKTIANVTITGNYTFGITLTGNTSVTFPTSGTLATTATAVSTGKSIAMAMIFGF